MNKQKHKVSGFNVDLLSFKEAVDFVLKKMSENNGLQIVTINPEMIETAKTNSELSEILNNSELVVADGSGIKLALKLKGINQERIAGIDFAKELIKNCSSLNYPIAMIGAKEDIINAAAEKLQNEFKELNICYKRNGYFTIEDEEKIINDIVNSNPKLVLAALGSPKQEIFIKKCREKINNSVFIGVGGSFDVWSGKVARAPEIFRLTGCEWIYRTFKQPERIKRIYKTLPLFLFKAIIEALSEKICVRGK